MANCTFMALSTSRTHATQIHVLRLLPGDDLLLSLREFVKTRALRAAFIITCVGSVGQCSLRPAGVPSAKTWDDRKFEIVSLTGTMECSADSVDGSEHLHMSVSVRLIESTLVKTTQIVSRLLIRARALSLERESVQILATRVL